MKSNLMIENNTQELHLLYEEPLGYTPEWVSLDIQHKQLFIGGEESQTMVELGNIASNTYERIMNATEITLILVTPDGKTALERVTVGLMVAQEM